MATLSEDKGDFNRLKIFRISARIDHSLYEFGLVFFTTRSNECPETSPVNHAFFRFLQPVQNEERFVFRPESVFDPLEFSFVL